MVRRTYTRQTLTGCWDWGTEPVRSKAQLVLRAKVKKDPGIVAPRDNGLETSP